MLQVSCKFLPCLHAPEMKSWFMLSVRSSCWLWSAGYPILIRLCRTMKAFTMTLTKELVVCVYKGYKYNRVESLVVEVLRTTSLKDTRRQCASHSMHRKYGEVPFLEAFVRYCTPSLRIGGAGHLKHALIDDGLETSLTASDWVLWGDPPRVLHG